MEDFVQGIVMMVHNADHTGATFGNPNLLKEEEIINEEFSIFLLSCNIIPVISLLETKSIPYTHDRHNDLDTINLVVPSKKIFNSDYFNEYLLPGLISLSCTFVVRFINEPTIDNNQFINIVYEDNGKSIQQYTEPRDPESEEDF